MATTAASRVAQLVCYLLFRLLLPCVLLVGAVVRYNAVSFLYTVFLLLCPLMPAPTSVTIRGCTGRYLRFVFGLGLFASLAHGVFHITLKAMATDSKPYGSMFTNCSTYEQLVRQIGLERLDTAPTVDIFRLVIPDVAVFVTALIVYIVCWKLLPVEAGQCQSELPTVVRSQLKRKVISVVEFIGEAMLVLLLAASGIIAPSVLSSVYFLSFLFLATLWSMYGNLGRKFAVFRVFLLVFNTCHILVLHLYQFQFFQQVISPTDFIARLLGLIAVVKTDCSSPYQIFFYDTSKWQNFINPGILLILFYTLAVEIRHHCEDKTLVLSHQPDAARTQKTRRHRQRKRGSEREVPRTLDESQKEHLVVAEIRDYSSLEPINDTMDREGSPTMLGEEAGTKNSEGNQEQDEGPKRSAWVTFFVYVMRQSYVLSLIAMMVWSILFHSWLTFVLLLSACIIWMFSNSRRICYVLSPFILFYGIGLLCIQFVFGMDLQKELPIESYGIQLEDIGLRKYPHPCKELAIQVAFTLCFWLTLRQYVREKRDSVLADGEKYPLETVGGTAPTTPNSRKSFTEMIQSRPVGMDSMEGSDSSSMVWIGLYVWTLLCKYWILVCASMLLVISLQEVVVYRIIYMILFLLFVLTFQFAFTFWRVTMRLFWWLVILYSMLVLIILYTYQFDNVAEAWRNTTKLSDDTLADIGLEHFDTKGLFIRLLTPTCFLILVILQVHYFHQPFMQLSDINRYKKAEMEGPTTPVLPVSPGSHTTVTQGSMDANKKKTVGKRFKACVKRTWIKAGEIWDLITWFLWRLAEIHIFKVVAFIIIMTCVYEVSAVSAVYVILLAVFLPMTGLWFVLSHLALLWTALVILSKMIYQLDLVDNKPWLTNCTGNISQNWPFNETINNAKWVGMDRSEHLGYYLRNYIGILLSIVLERIVVYRQTQYYNTPGVVKPKTGIIFSDIQRKQADEGLIECGKFFLNYFFYKFGLELCFIMTAITICVRVDAYSMLYAVLLGIQLLLSRRCCARVWPVYTIILVILLPLQYLLALGLPVGFCYQYLWDATVWILKEDETMELEQWFYLPDYFSPPNSIKLVADFFQLLFVCLQWRVFRKEMRFKGVELDGGTNEDILPEVEAKQPIPVSDFTTKITKYRKVSYSSYLDVVKNFVFVYMFWVTLAIVFIAGTSRINLFSMGYVMAVFYFMWFEREFLIKPLRRLLRAWNGLLGLCYFIMLLKAALQLPSCVYIDLISSKACWVVQLLGMTCLRPGYVPKIADTDCVVADDNTGLSLDVVCFVFLLLQRKIYTSHYFRHVVADFEAQNRLASRGCQLINRILMQQVDKQKKEEKQIIYAIKKKMRSLKEKQKNIKKKFVEPEEHFQAIRSGDYYLFDESEDETEVDDEINTMTFGQDPAAEEDKALSPIKLMTTAMTSGVNEAVKQSEQDEKDLDRGRSPRPTSPSATTETSDAAAEPDNQGLVATVTEEKKEGEKGTEEEQKGEGIDKVKTIFSFIVALLVSCANWMTALFNRISRNYRLVAAKMKDDHIRVKLQIQSETGHLTATNIEMREPDGEQEGATGAGDDLMEVSVQPVKPVDTQMVPVSRKLSLSGIDLDRFEEEEEAFEKKQSCIYRLLVATYFAIVARTEMVCYFLMVLNHILSASLLSLPLPMFAFLWGMLSVPRPTKTFWITVITYTEAVVVVKYLFQFGFFPWNNNSTEDDPFFPPRIIGIEQKDNFWVMDLILLIALFLHRTILKRYGLWKDEEKIIIDDSKMSSPPMSNIEATQEEIEEMEALRRVSRSSSMQAEPSMMKSPSCTSSLAESQRPDDDCDSRDGKEGKSFSVKALFKPFINFYKQLTCPDYNATTDVYAAMFVCDFINFLIIVFGYQGFGPSQSASGDVASYISENRIPIPFLIMLLAQFILIIVDRALYLRKNILGKFIFQILLVVLIHVWMFFIIPVWTGKSFTNNKPAALWYFLKCLYFYLSAYQIKCSYPTRILGNFLTKKYNYLNLFLFKGFLAIPFLLELRTLMDWIWTNTTMAIGSWLQMEDIYANIYILKCYRVIEKEYPTPRATPKSALIKYGVGGLLLFVVIFIIWFPLVLFSFANTVYQPNPPIECRVSVALAGYQPLFEIIGQQQNILQFSDSEFSTMKKRNEKDKAATSFLNNYKTEDVTKILLNGKSTSVWTISPPSRKQLVEDLLNPKVTMNLDFYVTFGRAPHDQTGESISKQFRKELTVENRNETAALLNGKITKPVKISNVFPLYIRLAKNSASPVTALLGLGTGHYTDIEISLQSDNSTDQTLFWWQINVPGNHPDNFIEILTFNDRVAPAGFALITGYGIIGLYVSLVLVIGRFVRVFFSDMSKTIMFDELPNVDGILSLCLNLYLARECGEYRLEEQLFSKLLFVYRSPEVMIRFTKPKTE
ncbi:piezo-type mechanosensitive ion channel component 1-like isoform X2 [Dreissena polymorpha]|uniref:piezo-type mechanosensitive ion channel component 1-like isoform X2 n=1 Tax=Dreissena polymorpha TaxID=45954 RepID=UPI0022652018|nr:piezo-type mechanosensitive ion channel component 1-like isoform X2 [Dreissena polymorpha]